GDEGGAASTWITAFSSWLPVRSRLARNFISRFLVAVGLSTDCSGEDDPDGVQVQVGRLADDLLPARVDDHDRRVLVQAVIELPGVRREQLHMPVGHVA